MKICWILVLCALQHVYYVNTTDDLYVTVMSERSGTEDDDYVAVQCPDGYFLVGCGIHGFYQDGLQVPHSGTQRCVAYNGGYDPNGVTAEARCRRRDTDTISSVVFEREKIEKGSIANLHCPDGFKVLDCLAYSPWGIRTNWTWADDTEQFCTSNKSVSKFCSITAICGHFTYIESGM
ncbi:hypothetical protein ACHWQZ_G012745 [Mnemiopsis leidyi]